MVQFGLPPCFPEMIAILVVPQNDEVNGVFVNHLDN